MFGKWRKEFHEKEYQKGQESVGREVAAQDAAEQQRQLREVASAAAETLKLAKELEADGDPSARELANRIRQAALGATGRVEAGEPGEGRAALEGRPFVPSLESSRGSETSSSGSTGALPSTGPSSPPEPPKRPRGRPRKHPRS